MMVKRRSPPAVLSVIELRVSVDVCFCENEECLNFFFFYR